MPITGSKRTAIINWCSRISYINDEAELFYMGSKQPSGKGFYHFVYVLCEYGGVIRSVINVERILDIPFGDKVISSLDHLTNRLCIIKEEYEADDVIVDDKFATVIRFYHLRIRKGVVTRFKYRAKEQLSAYSRLQEDSISPFRQHLRCCFFHSLYDILCAYPMQAPLARGLRHSAL